MFVAAQPGTSGGTKKTGGDTESFPVCRLNVIGRGSSSVVYRSVVLPELGVVAEKVITVAEKEKRHQLVRELRHLRGLLLEGGALCPAVVQLVSVVPHPREGTVSVCLELMDGGSLQDVVRAGGCRDEAVLSRIAFQVLCGLDFLHGRRQVHRDIKPGTHLLIDHGYDYFIHLISSEGNILVNLSGRVTISDFGISKELQSGQSLADTFVGTYNYMSP
jgi:serine/threonine protein kinase